VKWRSKILLWLCVGLCPVATQLAHGQGVPLTVHATVAYSGKPSRAYVVASHMGTVVGVAPALVVESNDTTGSEIVGQILLSDTLPDISVAFLVVDEGGSASSSLFDLSLDGQDAAALLSRAALRTELQERAIELKKREAQVRDYEQSLSRLQGDTDKIAQVDRIVDAEQQLESLRSDAKRLAAALNSVESRKQALKGSAAPPLLRRQEAEVTAELNALSVVLKSAEADALKRVSSASQELTSKLELIQSTKNEHIDLLQNELQSLIKQRQALESAKGSHERR
jgi:hypothetical protein